MPNAGSELALVSYFERGGLFMWPLLLCSLLGLAVIIYKVLSFWTMGRGSQTVTQEVLGLVRRGEMAQAAARCTSSPSAVAPVLGAILTAARSSREGLREEAQMAGNRQLATLEFGLPTLSTIAAVAPLLGFLGTVSGMIRAFEAIAQRGLGEPAVVANGIGEALITTATGLIVAIPCFVAYSYFIGRVNNLGLTMELAGAELLKLKPEGGDDNAT